VKLMWNVLEDNAVW